jgi:hypothetical protein
VEAPGRWRKGSWRWGIARVAGGPIGWVRGVEAKILAKTQEPPPAPVTHWTTRRMAALIGVSHVTVARVWQRAGL